MDDSSNWSCLTVAEVVNLRTGATNMPNHFDVAIRISAREGRPDSAVLHAIQEQTAFEANGGTVETTSELASDEAKEGYYYVTVRPKAALTGDTWWTFTFAHSRVVESAKHDGEPKRWRFFTGSAPRIAHVEISKANAVVYVEYSEPVDLGMLEPDSFLSIAGNTVSACILQGDKCADLQTGVFSESANVLVKGSPNMSTPVDVDIALPATIMGQGRTAAEGVSVAGGSLGISDDEVVLHVNAADWTPCNEGDALCWGYRRGQAE